MSKTRRPPRLGNPTNSPEVDAFLQEIEQERVSLAELPQRVCFNSGIFWGYNLARAVMKQESKPKGRGRPKDSYGSATVKLKNSFLAIRRENPALESEACFQLVCKKDRIPKKKQHAKRRKLISLGLYPDSAKSPAKSRQSAKKQSRPKAD